MNSVRAEHDWRGKLLAWKKDRSVIEGMELIDVMIADLDREKEESEQKKNTRWSERVQLRNPLRSLGAYILTQTNVREKGEKHDPPQQSKFRNGWARNRTSNPG